MLELKGISRIYKPKKGEPVKALDKIDLKFGKTGMIFVLGKSGSGKSTLLNVIGGLDKYDEGDLIVKGKSTKKFKQSEFDSYRNTMIGFIFQEYNVLDEFTVAQNIGLALELQGKKATNETVSAILKDVDLENYGSRKPNELSGGQKQRVAIARALVKEPQIIMADEPTGALDSTTGVQIFETLKKLSKSRLVIVVSHDREFAETYGDRIIEFKDGVIIADISVSKETRKTKNPITIEDKSIVIEQGYQLTEEDFRVINEYLKKSKHDTSVNRLFNQSNFVDTNTEEIEVSNENFKLIKSKLPFKSSLKIGASSLKHKTVRLVFSIILASVAFAMFALADTMGSYDKYRVTEQSFRDSEISYLTLGKVQRISSGSNFYDNTKRSTDLDVSNIQTLYPTLNFKPILVDQYNSEYSENVHDGPQGTESQFYVRAFAGYYELDEEFMEDTGMVFLGAGGRLPQNDNEVVIPSFAYEIFKKYGYRETYGGLKLPITQPNQLHGKKLKVNSVEYTVVGVVETNFNYNRFQPLLEPGQQNFILQMEFMEVLTSSYHNLLFVNEGFIANKAVSVGANPNNQGYQFAIDDTNTNVYIQTVFKISELETNEFSLFSGVSINNLNDNDILVSIETLNQFTNWELNNHYTNFVRAYLSIPANMSLENIRTALNNELGYTLGDSSAWTEGEKEDYISQYAYLVENLHWSGTPNPYGESYTELRSHAIDDFLSLNTPISISLQVTNYWQNGNITTESVRIVGVKKTGESYVASISVSDKLFNEYELEEEGVYGGIMAPMTSNSQLLQSMIKEHYKAEEGIVYTVRNEVMVTLNMVGGFIESTSSIFLYLGIGFAVFSALLLINFIATSVSYKKQEIGILRAIGARGTDVVGIFFKEAMIIALINFVLSNIIAIIGIVTINAQLRTQYGLLITLLNFGIRQVVLMLAISIVVAFLSSSIPVSRIARKRPIDAIRNK